MNNWGGIWVITKIIYNFLVRICFSTQTQFTFGNLNLKFYLFYAANYSTF